MKCIKSTQGTIVRATDREADLMVSKSNWVYCSKSEWKQKVRDAGKEKPVKKEKVVDPNAPIKTKKPKRSRKDK